MREFTGGDTGITQSVNTMFQDEAEAMRQRTGIDPAVMAYERRAIELLTD